MGVPAYGVVSRGLTCAEMIDEVQALTGTTDAGEPLATETRITRWINEAQRIIVKECPGLESLTFKNTTSIDITQSLVYDLNDITAGDYTTQDIAHIWYVKYLDGNESEDLVFLPTDEFDTMYPDPTHADMPISKAKHWTRRGGQIEIMPLSQCGYCDKDLRFDGDFYPRDFSVDSTLVSDISMTVDTGLIYYAVGEYYSAAGKPIEARIWQKKFTNPDPSRGDADGWLQEFKSNNDAMHSWDGDLYWPL